jgi:hypothetical protein
MRKNRDRDHDVEPAVDRESAGVGRRELARDAERIALERDGVSHHIGNGDALARMFAQQEARGPSVAAAEVEDGRLRGPIAEAPVQDLTQQPVSAPAAAVVVEQRALADAVVQPLEKAQQRIRRRDAAFETGVADRGAQVVVEQRSGRAVAVGIGGDRGGRGGLITRSPLPVASQR